MSYHLESSAGSLATFKIDESDKELWDKYSPEKFPVITWKSAHRNKEGADVSSVYVLPRTPEGLVKIGFRGIKVGLSWKLSCRFGANIRVVHQLPACTGRNTLHARWPVVYSLAGIRQLRTSPASRGCDQALCVHFLTGIPWQAVPFCQVLLVH